MFANSSCTCFTNGQCRQMNTASIPLGPATPWRETAFPVTTSRSSKSGAAVPSSFMEDGVRAMGYSFFHYEQPNQTRRMFCCGHGDGCPCGAAATGVGYGDEPAREQSNGRTRRTAHL